MVVSPDPELVKLFYMYVPAFERHRNRAALYLTDSVMKHPRSRSQKIFLTLQQEVSLSPQTAIGRQALHGPCQPFTVVMHRNNAKPYHFIFKTGSRTEYFSAQNLAYRVQRRLAPCGETRK
jgi:hypothetical protein